MKKIKGILNEIDGIKNSEGKEHLINTGCESSLYQNRDPSKNVLSHKIRRDHTKASGPTKHQHLKSQNTWVKSQVGPPNT